MTRFKIWMALLGLSWVVSGVVAIVLKEPDAMGNAAVLTFCTGLYYFLLACGRSR